MHADSAKRYVETLEDDELAVHLGSCKRCYHAFRAMMTDDKARELWTGNATVSDVEERAEWFRRAYWYIIARLRSGN